MTEDNKVEEKKTKTKKPKKKGPLRTASLVPITIVVVLAALYGRLYFDLHFKYALELAATIANKAEVNIGKLESSIFNASFKVKNIQVTNRKNPSQNLTQIDEMRFSLIWDALLRAKFVVKDAAILGVQLDTPRKKPGKLWKNDKKITDNKVFKETRDVVLKNAQKQFKGNVLENVAELLDGSDPKEQLKKIKGELITEQKINELSKELKEKEVKWSKDLTKLTDKRELENLQKRVKNFKFNKSRPLKSLKELKSIAKDSKNKFKEYKRASKELKSDVKKYKNALSQVDNWIEQDTKNLQSKLNVPSLNTQDLAVSLFAQFTGGSSASIEKYVDMAKEYMPPPKEKKAKEKSNRSGGQNFTYPKRKGYPTWWIQKASLSSKSDHGQNYGDLTGSLSNLSSSAALIKKNAVIDFSGNFPKINIFGVKGNIEFDQQDPKNHSTQFKVDINKYPLKRLSFANNENLTFGVKQTNVQSRIKGQIKDSVINMLAKQQFNQPEYQIKAKSKYLAQTLNEVTRELPSIYLNAKATGHYQDISWDLSSNLADEISKGIKRKLEAQINEARSQIKNMINSRVGEQRKKYESEYNKLSSKLDKSLKKYENELKNVEKKATNSLSKNKNKPVKKLENKAKDLFKKFKF